MSLMEGIGSLFEEVPFVYVINDDIHSYCHYCCTRKEKLRQCTTCRYATYCNEECEENAYFDHAEECRSLKKIYPKTVDGDVRLIARLLIKLKEHPEQFEHNGTDGPRTFAMLISHMDAIKKNEAEYSYFLKMSEDLCGFIDHKYLPSTSDALLEVYAKLRSNRFSMRTPIFQDRYGMGLFLELSALDHSCSPDARLVMSGRTMKLNAIKLYGDQIDLDEVASNLARFAGMKDTGFWKGLTVSYGWDLNSREERRKYLLDNYNFVCACSLCEGKLADCMELVRKSLRCPEPNCDGYVIESEKSLIDEWWEFFKLSAIWPVKPAGCCWECKRDYSDISSGLKTNRGLGKNLELTKKMFSAGSIDLIDLMKVATHSTSFTASTLHSKNANFNRMLAFRIDILYKMAHKNPSMAEERSHKNWFIANHEQYIDGLKANLFASFAPEIPGERMKIAALLIFYSEWEEAKSCLVEVINEAKFSHGHGHEIFDAIHFCLEVITKALDSGLPATNHQLAKIWEMH